MTFGERVTILRKHRKLKQTELGELIGTSGDIVSKYERGTITPSIDVASKMAKALNVSLDHLIDGSPKDAIDLSEVPLALKQFDGLLPEDKAHVIAVIEAFSTKAKLQSLIG
ncbi:helix-turn-helix transcriptional regulator [Chitinophaga polysaccharea]|uniref:helix-turn-helix domain-containing protein n=1 Tax=Chitinophaga TaxID=79328 RepID=UPI001455625B|nr:MULTISPECIES: helix-turn-helix transcriptional regulator [Chitinophaga]NLR58871.1 helix-turn-helix transcriptional regulator [Chitinophaga polysaccharea]NLU92317.1 helix-turn-helix transcriptional regulator [Chitinophaga sp. Ak27]